MFYSGQNTLSYNCLFNFVVGNRGCGKTFWFKSWAIKDFLKSGKQFVYVRRYDTEFDKKEKFFDDIEEYFPDHEFKIKGYTCYIDKKECGFFIPLSKAKNYKSTPYPKVNKICYDEFIIKRGFQHYLREEVTDFLELYETICRTRDNVKCFFFGNALSMTNPYFLYFNIPPDKVKNGITRTHEDILVEKSEDKEFIEFKNNTRFGKLIKSTKYGEYAINNKFLMDNDVFIKKKGKNAKHYFILIYNDKNYGVWIDYTKGAYYVSEDYQGNCALKYSLTTEDHKPNTLLLKSGQSRILKNFMENYKLGNVYFENINIKNTMFDIIRQSLI